MPRLPGREDISAIGSGNAAEVVVLDLKRIQLSGAHDPLAEYRTVARELMA